MKNVKKLFGEINLTWPKVIIFAVVMGIWTALMALLVPDGNSFHDIAVTPEWWVLPAIFIIVNCKSPLDAALKTFVFFLISQPLVYLIQVPFNSIGWGLFRYYPYWFGITLATFPGAYLGWFIKKDKWYSGVILAVMTSLLVVFGINYAQSFADSAPNHLLTMIYCFAIIPVFIFFILKDKIPRLITAAVTVVVAVVYFLVFGSSTPYEAYRDNIAEDYDIIFVGEPYISFVGTEGEKTGEVLLTTTTDEDGSPSYEFKLSGVGSAKYYFTVSDDENEYDFIYYYDSQTKDIVVDRR